MTRDVESPVTRRRRAYGRLLVSAVSGLVFAAGCRPAPPVPQPPARLGPIGSFQVVMERFKRRYQSVEEPTAIDSGDSGREPVSLQLEVAVTHTVPEPDPVTGKYRAQVTVRTTSRYSALSRVDERPPGAPADPLGQEDGPRPQHDAEPGQTGATPERVIVHHRTDQDARTYDLAYEDGRWALKTTNLDESVRMAFEYALADQR